MYFLDLMRVVPAMVAHGWSVNGALFVVLPVTVIIMNYVTMPLCSRMLASWLGKPRPQRTCEPLRSLEEGFCPFTPSAEAVAQQQRIAKLERDLHQARLRLDRRVSGLEHWVLTSRARSNTSNLLLHSISGGLSRVRTGSLDSVDGNSIAHGISSASAPAAVERHGSLSSISRSVSPDEIKSGGPHYVGESEDNLEVWMAFTCSDTFDVIASVSSVLCCAVLCCAVLCYLSGLAWSI